MAWPYPMTVANAGGRPRINPPIDAASAARGRVIERLRRSAGLSQMELGNRFGTDQSYVSKLERGVTDPMSVALERGAALAEALGMSVAALIVELGFGAVSEMLDQLDESVTDDQTNVLDDGTVMTSYYDFAAASPDIYPGIEPYRVGRRPVDPEDTRTGFIPFLVRGESMIPTVNPGDVIVVDTTNTEVEDGLMYLLALPHDQVCVKRIVAVDGEWWLYSDNPDQRTFRPRRIPDGAIVRGRVRPTVYPPARRGVK